MTWDDIDDILYDGTPEQIATVKCLDCGKKLHFRYEEETFEISCSGCGHVSKAHGGPIPNCIKINRNIST